MEEIFAAIAEKPMPTSASAKARFFASDPRVVVSAKGTSTSIGGDADADIEVAATTVSLRCKLSLKDIAHPVVGTRCDHSGDAMDLEQYLAFNAGNPQPTCYVCGKPCAFRDLRVNPLVELMLERGARVAVELTDTGVVQTSAGGATQPDSQESGWFSDEEDGP